MTHAATGGHTPTTENAANAAAAAFEHYPLYCYHLSPTITQWCPLRARDIHELAQRRGFEGQDDTFFHLNHPIRWVRVVGVVVAVDQYYGRRVYTIDDGSGACIECVTTVPITTKKPEEAVAATAAAAAAPEETKDPYADIDVGLVVDARGGLALYRQQKQVRVTRLRRLASTAAETAFWHKIRAFAADVLARPWVVDARVRRRLEKEARRDVVGGGGGGGVDSDARRRQRSRRDRDDQERNNNDGDDAKAARKRRRHHRDEEERESVRGGGDGGDDDDAGARKKLEDRQRRKERHTGNNETSNGIPPRTGSSLRDEARKERRAGDDATSNNIPSRTGNSLHDEARQRRKDRPTPTGNNERPNGIPPRTGNSLLDESRRRRREKAEKLRESSQPVASSGKYSALGL